jgi:hypothetical protein
MHCPDIAICIVLLVKSFVNDIQICYSCFFIMIICDSVSFKQLQEKLKNCTFLYYHDYNQSKGLLMCM